jgi:hypothetical protein
LKQSDKETKTSNDYLNNSIAFEGTITKIRRSTNHAFGIIELKLIRSSVKEFDKKVEEGIYPYKIRDGKAEVYCTVSVERKLGDSVNVVSKDHTIYFNPQNSKEEGSLYILNDAYNISFVKENTIFK